MKRDTLLLIGLGQTGHAFLDFLQRHNDNRRVIAFAERQPDDLAKLQRQYPAVQFHFGELPGAEIQRIQTAWTSPGIPPASNIIQTLQQQHIPIKSDVQVFAELARVPVIAITGTNGKSTVTTLVTEMLQAAGVKAVMGGNIGIPALALLSQPVPDVYVLELSSFQLYYTSALHTKVAALLNLAPDHIDWHGSFVGYAEAKRRIFQGAETALDFSESGPQDNIGQALEIVKACGADMAKAEQAIKTFTRLPHRCEPVATINGVEWIDDSKATNVHAAVYAINQFAAQGKAIILLAGGVGKGQDFQDFAKVIAAKVKRVIVFGEARHDIIKTLQSPYTEVAHLTDAVQLAKQIVVNGDVVLLSPACASFDEFNNFAERGETFKRYVL